MVTSSISVPIYTAKFEHHKELKEKVLGFINDEDFPAIENKNFVISKSDYGINASHQRRYLSLIREPLIKQCFEIMLDAGYKNFNCTYTVNNFWFQQYEEESSHTWHTHSNCQFTGVYYLEFPKGSPKTFFMDPMCNNEENCFEAEEGDILIFPSFVVHRADKNNSTKRKTIISFNSSICI